MQKSGDFWCGVKETAEAATIGEDKEQLKDGRDGTGHDACAAGHGEVEEQDVDDDRGKDGETERNETTDQEEEPADELTETDEGHPLMLDEDSGERGGVAGGLVRHGEKGKEDVGAEDDEHEAEQDADDEGGFLHGAFSG